jgi:hypothetical protein
METNINRAKEIRAPLPANVAAAQAPLRLTFGAPGELPKLLGERIAVNALQADVRARRHPISNIRAEACVFRQRHQWQHAAFEWHLADVWLNFPAPSPAQVGTSNSAGTPLHPARAPLPGAKP